MQRIIPPLHPEGHRFVAIFLIATVALWFFWMPLGITGAVLTLWCAAFFRDPVRMVPRGPGLLVAPADGVVSQIVRVETPAEITLGDGPFIRVSIFMNVFNVHVNRAPVAGQVTERVYVPGKFLNAELDKASEDNERLLLKVRGEDGTEFGVVQIAGLVARRILTDAEVGDQLVMGERIGLIRFGSRVDVYLPPGYDCRVSVGQQTVAGETVIAATDKARLEGAEAI